MRTIGRPVGDTPVTVPPPATTSHGWQGSSGHMPWLAQKKVLGIDGTKLRWWKVGLRGLASQKKARQRHGKNFSSGVQTKI